MLGRVKAVVLLSLLLAVDAIAQCNFSPVFSGELRASALDLFLDGNDLWVATSYGIALYDHGVDPPALVASIPVPGVTRVVRAANGTAYVGSGSSIYVVRKSGKTLQNVRGVDAGATVNDIVFTTTDLYVATANGLAQYDLLDPTTPKKTTASLATSSPTVTSLTTIGSTLYAADNDSTIEVFSFSIPTLVQKIGTINSLARPTSVKTSDNRLYVSDGQQTEIFAGTGANMSHLSTLSFGSTSLATISGDLVAAAGNDRRLRVFDLTLAGQPVELFRDELAATAGSINRITGLWTTTGRLFVAAGDLGLLTFDSTVFNAAFPVRAYPTGPTTSVFSLGTSAFFSKAAGGLTEFIIGSTGSLTPGRSWDASHTSTIHDGGNGFILTSSGSTLTYWTVTSQSPVAVSVANLRANVHSAIVVGSTAFAVLDDRSLWSVDLTQSTATPQAIPISGAKPSLIAHDGNSIAVADLRDDGTTAILFFSTPDLTATPKQQIVPGTTTSGLTVTGSTAYVFTFQGITQVSFDGIPSTTVLPASGVDFAHQLLQRNTFVYELTDGGVSGYTLARNVISLRTAIPGEAVAMHSAPGSNLMMVATAEGVASMSLTTAAGMPPAPFSTANGNAFYKKIAAADDRVLLVDGRGVDYFTGSLHYLDSIRNSALVDAGVTADTIATLTTAGVVTAYSTAGVQRAQITLSEGTDAQPLAVHSAGGALWISLEKGCLTTGCEEKTLVYDSKLNQTASFPGGVVDVVTSGARAYVITDLPAEVRIYNIADALHPVQLATIPAEGSRPVQSIAFGGDGVVYVLGDKLYGYSSTSLSKVSEQLGSYVNDPAGIVAYVDQRVRIDGNCGLVTGRTFNPSLYGVAATWAAASTPLVPAAVRSVAQLPGKLLLLTDDSVEVWSTAATPKAPRRRGPR